MRIRRSKYPDKLAELFLPSCEKWKEAFVCNDDPTISKCNIEYLVDVQHCVMQMKK